MFLGWVSLDSTDVCNAITWCGIHLAGTPRGWRHQRGSCGHAFTSRASRTFTPCSTCCATETCLRSVCSTAPFLRGDFNMVHVDRAFSGSHACILSMPISSEHWAAWGPDRKFPCFSHVQQDDSSQGACSGVSVSWQAGLANDGNDVYYAVRAQVKACMFFLALQMCVLGYVCIRSWKGVGCKRVRRR